MRVFLDANVLIDMYDTTRRFHRFSNDIFKFLLLNSDNEIFTSCDIITTLYYIGAKKDKTQILLDIQNINKTLKVIEFSNKEVEETCKLMLEDSDYKDLEDTIQYVMAKKYKCDLIISNDELFVSKDIELISSEKFYKKVVFKAV